MNEVLQEWVEKAEEDWAVATALRGSTLFPFHGSVCFHVQQCVEKLMKAVLIARDVTPPKTHDLVELHELLLGVEPQWQGDEASLWRLTRSSVIIRYPGDTASPADAAWAVAFAGPVRAALSELLPEAVRPGEVLGDVSFPPKPAEGA